MEPAHIFQEFFLALLGQAPQRHAEQVVEVATAARVVCLLLLLLSILLQSLQAVQNIADDRSSCLINGTYFYDVSSCMDNPLKTMLTFQITIQAASTAR